MKTRNALILLGAGILFAGLFLSCETAQAVPITNAAGSAVSGTATGTAPSYGGEASVTLTVVDGFITEVVAAAPHDTPMFSGPVLMRASTDMVRFNVPEMDIVSGATITSMAINQAAQAALNQIIAGQ
ncbi:MAG: FMN-binding protein [Treponema sp.]|nr:FMN-binding protein [Treponema sp.]